MDELNYAVQQRLRLIDFLLHQYGAVNRSALTGFFGISTPQASADLKAYQRLVPGNLVYCGSQKAYLRTASFKQVWP